MINLSPLGNARPSGVPERTASIHLTDGRQLAWSEWGPADGRPVLSLHGTPGSSRYCEDTVATAEMSVRVIAPDRPGFGDSDPMPGRSLLDTADDVFAMMKALDLRAAPIVGISSGVPFAMACAVRHPEAVTTLALVAGDAPMDELPPAAGDEADEFRDRIARRRADPVSARVELLEKTRWFAERPESIREDANAGDTADEPDAVMRRTPEFRAAFLPMLRHAAKQGSAGWVDDSLAITLPWGFSPAAICCPTTVWFGDRDHMASRRDSEHIAAVIPGARFVVVPNEGHSLPIRNWRAILSSVLPDRVESLHAPNVGSSTQ